MASHTRDYIYARATIALATAGRALGIDVDLDALAPTLRRQGVLLVPADEHFAVAPSVFEDRR